MPEKKKSEKRPDLLCRMKYQNTLPDIPFDPKFIKYPFEGSRFIQYNPTTLERNFQFDLLAEHDLDIGKNLDFLILPDLYSAEGAVGGSVSVDDEKLLEEEPATPTNSQRSKHHNKYVPWLRKTEYISTEYNRFTQSSAKSETKVGYSIKKKMREEDLYRDRDSQIAAIEKTFELANQPIDDHYSKPGVKAVEVLSLLPDFTVWRYPCAQVIFDSDPAKKDLPTKKQVEQMSHAMIRGMSDESGEQFVAYFLPTDDTLEKRHRLIAEEGEVPVGEKLEFELTREYNWNVKNKASTGYDQDYFFIFRPDGVFYNELETRVRLSKRKRKAVVGRSVLDQVVRPFTDPELTAQEVRLEMLEQQQEEAEDDAPMDETANNPAAESTEPQEEKEEEIPPDLDGSTDEEKDELKDKSDDTVKGVENNDNASDSEDEGPHSSADEMEKKDASDSSSSSSGDSSP